jgi:hypothetical protein
VGPPQPGAQSHWPGPAHFEDTLCSQRWGAAGWGGGGRRGVCQEREGAWHVARAPPTGTARLERAVGRTATPRPHGQPAARARRRACAVRRSPDRLRASCAVHFVWGGGRVIVRDGSPWRVAVSGGPQARPRASTGTGGSGFMGTTPEPSTPKTHWKPGRPPRPARGRRAGAAARRRGGAAARRRGGAAARRRGGAAALPAAGAAPHWSHSGPVQLGTRFS